MKAFVTSTGEPTTDLCVWSLKRSGFDVVLIQNDTSLAEKLKVIYDMADYNFIRVDADVIPNQNLTEACINYARPEVWWIQFLTFDWYKQDVTHGGVQLIKREAIPYLREKIANSLGLERPETYMFRIPEFHNPRRCESSPVVMGLHGYKNDIEKAYQTKKRRDQLHYYDFDLSRKINEL